jgi:hypothetical protein
MIGDFATKVDLPEKAPSPADIRQFSPDPSGKVEAWFTFRTGNTYWFEKGHVSAFRSAENYFELQDSKCIPAFYGRLEITQEEAVAVARHAVQKLGYSHEEAYTDLSPDVIGPPQVGTNVVPRFLIKWAIPNQPGYSVIAEVNGSTKKIEKLELLARGFARKPPSVPGLVASPPQPPETHTNDPTEVKPMLLEIRRLIRLLRLPVPEPRDLDDVAESASHLEHFEADASIRLKGGFVFKLRRGTAVGFTAPDSFFFANSPIRTKDFAGPVHLTDEQAVVLARRAITGLGQSISISRPPEIRQPYGGARDIVPRRLIEWATGDTLAIVEVDMESGALKYLLVYGQKEPP